MHKSQKKSHGSICFSDTFSSKVSRFFQIWQVF